MSGSAMQGATPSADSLRTVLDSVFAGPAYDWVEAENPFGWIERAWSILVAFLERLRNADPLIFRIGLAALCLILAGIIAHAGWVMLRTMRHASVREEHAGGTTSQRRDAAWFDREADRLAGEGRHVEALQAAFTALALRLEDQGAVRYDPARTPREYVREARLVQDDRHRLHQLVTALYRHAFGGAPVDAAAYAAWRASAQGDWRVATA